MRIYQTGNLFKAARITGPTHHFLAIEFDEMSSEYEVLNFKDRESIYDEILLKLIHGVFNEFQCLLPIKEKYYIRYIFINKEDIPDIVAYHNIFKEILYDAERRLI